MAIQVNRAGQDDYGSAVKMLVVGDAGSGKTRTSSCWPDPLVLNADGGLMSVADRETPNITIKETGTLGEVLLALQQPADVRRQVLGVPVKTVVLDTVDEIARMFVRERLASERKEALAIQDWGWLGDQLRGMVRAFRNLDMHVIFNVHAKTQEDSETGRSFVKPGIQGAMGDEIAGYVDIAVLLQARPVVTVINGQNQRVIQRFMQTYPDPMHPWIKDRSGKLPQEFPINFDDDFDRIDALLFSESRKRAVADLKAIGAQLTPEEAPAPEEEVVPAPEAAKPKRAAKKAAAVAPEPAPEPPAPEPAPEPPAPDPESGPEPQPVPTPEPQPEPAPEPAASTPGPEATEAEGEAGDEVTRHPEGTYDDSPDAVPADCPKGYGCIIDKDMADLSYIRHRRPMCRSCFAEAKKKKTA